MSSAWRATSQKSWRRSGAKIGGRSDARSESSVLDIGARTWSASSARPRLQGRQVADAVERNRARAANPIRSDCTCRRAPDDRRSRNRRHRHRDPGLDAHFELAAAALKAGKHVLVEKPLCATAAESTSCLTLPTRRSGKSRSTIPSSIPARSAASREMTDRGELGRILYYDLDAHQSRPVSAR